MKLRKFIILLIGILLIIGCSSKPEPDTLLRLGKKYYSLVDFFDVTPKQNFIKSPENSKISKIENWAESQLIMFAAEKENFDQNNDKIKNQIEKLNKQADVRHYLDRTILDSVITEESLKKVYKNMGKEVDASHILIQYRDKNPKSDRTKEEALALAEELHKKAEKGENFAELAKKYTDDTFSNADGSLGYFKWGKMVKQFQEKAFSMKPGEISNPVETRFGYHIIKIHDVKKIPTKSFEEEREKLTNMAIKSKNRQLNATYKKRVKDLKKEYNFEINSAVLDTIISKVNLSKKVAGHRKLSDIEYLKKLKINMPLGKCNGNEITLSELVDRVSESHFRLPPSFVNQKYFKGVVENIYVTDLFLTDLEKRNIPYTDKFKKSIDSQKKRVIVTEFRKELFSKNIEVTEADMQSYYDDNKEKRYMTAPKAEVREIFLKNRNEAQNLLKDVMDKPGKFEEFSEKLTERYNKKEKPGYLGKISTAQYGEIGKIAVNTKENTIHPDIIRAGKGWSIIKVYNKVEATARDFKNVKSSINRILLNKKKNENKEKVMEDLKNKYNFKIYWECVTIEK